VSGKLETHSAWVPLALQIDHVRGNIIVKRATHGLIIIVVDVVTETRAKKDAFA
jgi:hypothetical protein